MASVVLARVLLARAGAEVEQVVLERLPQVVTQTSKALRGATH